MGGIPGRGWEPQSGVLVRYCGVDLYKEHARNTGVDWRAPVGSTFRLLTKYRDICPSPHTTKSGHISRYLVNDLFIVYRIPCFQ